MGFGEDMDPVLLYLGLSGALKYYLYNQWKDRKPANAKLVGTVTGLQLYPFKSAFGLEQDQMQLNSYKGPSNGPVTDRHWMVITDQHKMITSRDEPLISRIVPRFDGDVMILSYPGLPDLSLDARKVELAAHVIDTDVHAVYTQALDCGEAASAWISQVLSKDGWRIAYSGKHVYTRGVIGGNKKYVPWTRVAKTEDKIAFHDSISLHMIAEESMADLNTKLETPLDILRFRPNIVVKTSAEPYSEDTWKEVFIGDVRLRALKLCARCVLPNVDPETGIKSPDDQPLKTLSKYRNFLGGILGPAFGVDLIVEKPGTIRLNDPIYVIRGDNVAVP